jgi:uncharacterized membrane protein YcaP (DUF421 family)
MDLVLRAAFAFVFILFATRIMGRRELSSLQPFDLILLVVIGDLVQQGVTQSDYSVTGIVIVLGTIAIMQVGTSYVRFRFRSLRPLLGGEPVIVLQDGKPIEGNLERERLTADELAESARLQGIGSLDEVAWAVLERNGQISFIKRSN